MTVHPVAEALNSTAALIKMGWCQGSSAQTDRGMPCDPRDPNARSWCLSGAMMVCSQDEKVRYWARKTLKEFLGGPVEHWNDATGRTVEQVLVSLAEAAILAGELEPMDVLGPVPDVQGTFTDMLKAMNYSFAPVQDAKVVELREKLLTASF